MQVALFLLFSALLYACGGKTADTAQTAESTKEWELLWSDEFDYSGLPDSRKWNYEEGFIRNHEKQYYTTARLANIFVKDGLLTIKCIKENYKNKDYHNPSLASTPGEAWKTVDEYASYTSASINTKGKYELKYGKIEVRAKLPRGKGVWPAIWTMGADIHSVGWPQSGEIDILEFTGNNPDSIQANFHYVNPHSGTHAQKQGKTTVESPWDDFYIYSMEWDETSIIIKYDGKAYHSFDTKSAGGIFDKPNYMLLNFALGGAMGGDIDDSILPQEYQIDYVRVYQRKEK